MHQGTGSVSRWLIAATTSSRAVICTLPPPVPLGGRHRLVDECQRGTGIFERHDLRVASLLQTINEVLDLAVVGAKLCHSQSIYAEHTPYTASSCFSILKKRLVFLPLSEHSMASYLSVLHFTFPRQNPGAYPPAFETMCMPLRQNTWPNRRLDRYTTRPWPVRVPKHRTSRSY